MLQTLFEIPQSVPIQLSEIVCNALDDLAERTKTLTQGEYFEEESFEILTKRQRIKKQNIVFNLP